MRYHVTVAERTFEVDLGPEGVTVDGRPVSAELVAVQDTGVHSLLVDGASHRLVARRVGKGEWDLHVRGRRLGARVLDERTRRIREMTARPAHLAAPAALRAPMPGLVVRVEVREGDEVHPGQGLVIVEAMKMENELKAEAAGRVKRVWVAPGQAVEKDQALVDFEAPPPEVGS